MKYEVIANNFGVIYHGSDKGQAEAEFKNCRQFSIDNIGRFAGENVTLFCDNEIVEEYIGTLESEQI